MYSNDKYKILPILVSFAASTVNHTDDLVVRTHSSCYIVFHGCTSNVFFVILLSSWAGVKIQLLLLNSHNEIKTSLRCPQQLFTYYEKKQLINSASLYSCEETENPYDFLKTSEIILCANSQSPVRYWLKLHRNFGPKTSFHTYLK